MKPFSITLEGYGLEEKVVGKTSAKAGNVYLPADWIGKTVRIVLCEPKEESN